MAGSLPGSAGTYRQLFLNRVVRVTSAVRKVPAEAGPEEVLAAIEAEVREILGIAAVKKKSKKAE